MICQMIATLDDQTKCFACLGPHRIFQKDDKGEYVCPVTRDRVAKGLIPAVGRPGPNPPKGKFLKKPKRLFPLAAESDGSDERDDEWFEHAEDADEPVRTNTR